MIGNGAIDGIPKIELIFVALYFAATLFKYDVMILLNL